MSKRSHDDFSRAEPVMTRVVTAGAVETGPTQSNTKRLKVNEATELDASALDVLLQNADLLKKAVKELKRRAAKGSTPDCLEPELKSKLVELSQTLAPAFNTLSGGQSGGQRHRDDLASLTKFTSADVYGPLVSLPEILDPDLKQQALTHQGTVNVGEEHKSYERMEWMGDAYLEVICSCFIHKTFPLITSGQCAQHREILVRNQTLAQYTVQYGLDKQARLPAEFMEEGRMGGTVASSKERTKVLGDLFEAWIGAVVHADTEHGIARAAEFLKPLWARTLQKHIFSEEKRQSREIARIASGETGRERSPKEELLVILGVKGVKVDYNDIPFKKPKKDADLGLEMFKVGCYLHGWGESGKELGVGTATSKREAGQKAALAAMGNKKLMKFYGDKKKAFMEVQAQQAALAEAAGSAAPAVPAVLESDG